VDRWPRPVNIGDRLVCASRPRLSFLNLSAFSAFSAVNNPEQVDPSGRERRTHHVSTHSSHDAVETQFTRLSHADAPGSAHADQLRFAFFRARRACRAGRLLGAALRSAAWAPWTKSPISSASASA